MRAHWLFLAGLLLPIPSPLPAAEPAAPSAFDCRAVELARDPGTGNMLELPDGDTIDWAAGFETRLSGELTRSGRFRVITGVEQARRSRSARTIRSGSGLQWQSSQNPAVRLRLRFPEVSFRTGSRGERMLYGWTSRMTPATEPNPFQNPASDFGADAFAPRDAGLTGTYAGLDLGEGLSLDLLFAWLRIRLSRFDARVGLEVEATTMADGAESTHPLRARARGFFFDVSGGYLEYAGGLRASRTDAMRRALDRAVEATVVEIATRFTNARRVAQVDGWTFAADGSSGEILLATASGCPLPEGLMLADADGGLLIRVRESHENGGIGEIVQGKSELLSIGALLREEENDRVPAADSILASEVQRGTPTEKVPLGMLEASEEVLPRPDALLEENGITEKPEWQVALERIAGTALLPYRIYRFFQHDQAFHRTPDPVIDRSKPWASIENWSRHAAESRWGRMLRLSELPDHSEGVLVAVLDTGADYNHPVLHARLWINPSPEPDAFGEIDRYGWDFVSDDRRADDDHDRGTELASLVLAVAPESRLLPVKVFNPWGVTRADLLASGIRYATSRGAKVILAAWEGVPRSRDLEASLEEARLAGVRIVTSGDAGLPLSASEEFEVLRPRLRHGKLRGNAARAAIAAGLLAREGLSSLSGGGSFRSGSP